MESESPFPGSYGPGDVGFLMRRLELRPIALPEREQAIQSGARHYSEMIGPEDAPTHARMRLFRACLEMNGRRFAGDLVTLAEMLVASAKGRSLTLVSLARAGTPIGVLLQRIIQTRAGWSKDAVRHYSISVIRDRGVDAHALDWIISRHPPETIRFLDGWTGKGTISGELAASLGATPRFDHIDPGLWVPLDISGSARHAASEDDYLLPSSLLGGTISGLVSRSVLPREDIGAARFHGCVELSRLRRYDVSRWFAAHIEALCCEAEPRAVRARLDCADKHARSQEFISELMTEFGINDRNRVKIGIGETVRVALRRLPERILLRDLASPDAQFIARLAAFRGVPVESRPAMPHEAVGLIASVLASP